METDALADYGREIVALRAQLAAAVAAGSALKQVTLQAEIDGRVAALIADLTTVPGAYVLTVRDLTTGTTYEVPVSALGYSPGSLNGFKVTSLTLPGNCPTYIMESYCTAAGMLYVGGGSGLFEINPITGAINTYSAGRDTVWAVMMSHAAGVIHCYFGDGVYRPFDLASKTWGTAFAPSGAMAGGNGRGRYNAADGYIYYREYTGAQEYFARQRPDGTGFQRCTSSQFGASIQNGLPAVIEFVGTTVYFAAAGDGVLRECTAGTWPAANRTVAIGAPNDTQKAVQVQSPAGTLWHPKIGDLITRVDLNGMAVLTSQAARAGGAGVTASADGKVWLSGVNLGYRDVYSLTGVLLAAFGGDSISGHHHLAHDVVTGRVLRFRATTTAVDIFTP